MNSTHSKRLLAAAAMVVAAAAVLTGCSTTASSAGSGSGSGSTSSKEFKAVVLSDGPKNDQSWSNSVFNGLSQISKDLNVKTDFVGSNTTADSYVQQGSAYASQGYDMILITNGAEQASAEKLATSFPDVLVCQGPESLSKEALAKLPKNMCVWNLKQQDGTFLAGVVAGLVTKTNKLGAVDGGEFPAVIRQSEGFVLGARCVNPKATMTTQFTGSFSDVSAAKAAAQTQIAGGADVILSAVDGAVKGVYSAAQSADDTYVVPSYFDSYDQAPDVVLTSVLYNLNGITADLIEKAAQGKLKGQSYSDYTYANLKVGELAGFHGRDAVTKDIQAKLAEVEKDLRDGSIVVPNEDGDSAPLGTVGAGSKIDPASIGCK